MTAGYATVVPPPGAYAPYPAAGAPGTYPSPTGPGVYPAPTPPVLHSEVAVTIGDHSGARV